MEIFSRLVMKVETLFSLNLFLQAPPSTRQIDLVDLWAKVKAEQLERLGQKGLKEALVELQRIQGQWYEW
jgi:hypothetical protein